MGKTWTLFFLFFRNIMHLELLPGQVERIAFILVRKRRPVEFSTHFISSSGGFKLNSHRLARFGKHQWAYDLPKVSKRWLNFAARNFSAEFTGACKYHPNDKVFFHQHPKAFRIHLSFSIEASIPGTPGMLEWNQLLNLFLDGSLNKGVCPAIVPLHRVC